MTRQEHLDWAKERALEYIEAGDLRQAFTSFASDMQKHPELQRHAALEIGMQRMLIGDFRTPADMKGFIEGFN